MTDDRQQALIEALDRILENEREALITGRLEALPLLLEQKETLIDALNEATGIAPEDLQPLRGKVKRNQDLLDGALKGIRAVANRFATLRKIRRTLETYDDQGRKSTLPVARDNKLEKRA